MFVEYEGEWLESMPHGKGTFNDFITEEMYDGEYKMGERDGFGEIYLPEDAFDLYYRGHWRKGKESGNGFEVN